MLYIIFFLGVLNQLLKENWI